VSYIVGRICCIPVVIHIKNTSSTPISFQFNATNTKDILSRKNQYWEGNTVKNVNDLLPEESVEVTLNAIMEEYGAFNLNRFLFKFYTDPNTKVYLNPVKGITNKLKPFFYALKEEQVIVTITEY